MLFRSGRGVGFLGLYSSSVLPVDGISGLSSSSRVHVSTGMRTVGGKIAAGSEVQGTVLIPQAFRRGPLVCFLLTADARSRDLYFPREFWLKVPIEYSISLNGQFLRRGRLGDLHPPLTLRINRRRSSVNAYLQGLAGQARQAQQVGESAVVVSPACPVDELPGWHEGLVSVQDEGAQRAALTRM